MPELKRDPYLFAFYIVLLLCATYLLERGSITGTDMAIFFTGSAAMPALFRKRSATPAATTRPHVKARALPSRPAPAPEASSEPPGQAS